MIDEQPKIERVSQSGVLACYMWRCEKCGNWSTKNPKICSCKIFCVIDVDGEEHEIRALDAEEAALRYAEKANVEGDYYLMNDTEDITVDGMAFRVGAEPDVSYSVSIITST